MTCRERIVSQDYREILLDYNISNEVQEDVESDYCIQRINNRISILYYRDASKVPVNIVREDYYGVPKCYGLMTEQEGSVTRQPSGLGSFDSLPLINAGILSAQREPLSLTGRGTVIGMIDTGIRYTQEVFRDSDGNSRIRAIWDQNDQSGNPPAGQLYGTEYTREQLDVALQSDTPREVVPTWDENGHGTAMASVAAGSRLEEGRRFLGAAPEADIVVVRLKPAKQYLRDYYMLPEGIPAYSETDLLTAVKYIDSFAETFVRPVIICLGIGSSNGSHTGVSLLEEYLEDISERRSRVVVVCGGNEGDEGLHFQGSGTGNTMESSQTVELRVGEGESGFILEFWGEGPGQYIVDVKSPGGERVIGISGRTGQTAVYNFVFERTRLTVDYIRVEASAGRGLILFRFEEPTPGIWTFTIQGRPGIALDKFEMWLPIRSFLQGETYFLQPDPYITLTEPSLAQNPITVGAYRDQDNSLYAKSGRGYSADGRIKPDLTAPGVEISTSLGKRTGTSYAAAMAAGGAAQLMQWAVVNENAALTSSLEAKYYMILGATRDTGISYPNREWGYGRLNIRGIFTELAGLV